MRSLGCIYQGWLQKNHELKREIDTLQKTVSCQEEWSLRLICFLDNKHEAQIGCQKDLCTGRQMATTQPCRHPGSFQNEWWTPPGLQVSLTSGYAKLALCCGMPFCREVLSPNITWCKKQIPRHRIHLSGQNWNLKRCQLVPELRVDREVNHGNPWFHNMQVCILKASGKE